MSLDFADRKEALPNPDAAGGDNLLGGIPGFSHHLDVVNAENRRLFGRCLAVSRKHQQHKRQRTADRHDGDKQRQGHMEPAGLPPLFLRDLPVGRLLLFTHEFTPFHVPLSGTERFTIIIPAG